MFKKSKSQNFVSKIIFSLWIGLILLTFVLAKDDILYILFLKRMHVRLIELLIILAILGECFFFKHVFHHWTIKKKAIMLFIFALISRLIFLPAAKYIPNSDFTHYFNGACHFVNNGFSGGVYPPLESYGIPSFALQAIINGFFLNILSPTLLGMQLLNSLYTSGICVMLFLLGKNINEKAAIMSAIFYTFYPSSILSSQITTNHHGAAFFMLLGIYFFFTEFQYKKTTKRFTYLFASAICLVISNCYHPSIIITLCAFAAYALVYEFEKCLYSPRTFIQNFCLEIRNFRGIFLSVIVLLIFYLSIWTSTMTILKNSGYMKNTSTISSLSKLVVGFNFETEGSYCREDYSYIRSIPIEDQNKECIRLVQTRIKENGMTNTIKLMLKKNRRAWLEKDNYFYNYQASMIDKLTEKIENMENPILKSDYDQELRAFRYCITDIGDANSLFNYFIWLLALVGIVTILKKYNSDHFMYMLMYIPLGWMLFIMITEVQARYRYQGMTVIILAAGLGAETLRNWFDKFYHQHSSKNNS